MEVKKKGGYNKDIEAKRRHFKALTATAMQMYSGGKGRHR